MIRDLASLNIVITSKMRTTNAVYLKYDVTENSVRASSAFRVTSISLWERFHSIFAIICSDHRHWLHRLYRSYCVCEYCRNIVEISRERPCDRILGPATLIIFNPISYVFAYADYDVFERPRLRSLARWM